ncbi:Protein ENHANCED DISEASE RESISTANCE 2-like [Glycine soja]|uniref:Protein ENHANCED DISEASE RESISTANCE 2 C-terminal domain-containing protein n=2 Tax=Glycine subgen. Soja TaxID=1462606 RepID=A0A0R0FQE3_SOYBN|nr:Protein ENHANCED DISEASE RESISTANCE 2-like [Glycine soja]
MLPPSSNPRRSLGNAVESSFLDWISDSINGGSLRCVDLNSGTNGWVSPPGSNRQKCPAEDYLLLLLKSTTKLDHVLSRAHNNVMHALRRSQSQTLGRSLKSFVFTISDRKDHHSAVFYFAIDAPDPLRTSSLLNRFVHGNDVFRNQRFKLVNWIEKGPWIVKKAMGSHSACLLGKVLNCIYYKGSNYLKIDVDIEILHLVLGYVTTVMIDMGFVVEAQAEEELLEWLIDAIRVCHMEMALATVIESPHVPRGIGLAKVNHHKSTDELALND